MKKIYRIYANQAQGEPTLLAEVDGSKVTGPKAENIREGLIEGGWPKIAPNQIYNNGYTITRIIQVPTAGL
jgi:hypothetical protein